METQTESCCPWKWFKVIKKQVTRGSRSGRKGEDEWDEEETDRQTENSKTLFYNDCDLGTLED